MTFTPRLLGRLWVGMPVYSKCELETLKGTFSPGHRFIVKDFLDTQVILVDADNNSCRIKNSCVELYLTDKEPEQS